MGQKIDMKIASKIEGIDAYDALGGRDPVERRRLVLAKRRNQGNNPDVNLPVEKRVTPARKTTRSPSRGGR